ncbi:MAG: hypothetical protein V4658_15290 [Bacteroidota bacterium]
MKTHVKTAALLLLCLSSIINLSAQIESDSSGIYFKYYQASVLPRVGISYQKIPGIEAGISLVSVFNDARYAKHSKMSAGGCGHASAYLSGTYVSDNKHQVPGVRLGAEIVYVGHVAMMYRLELTDYFFEGRQYLCLTPAIVLPLASAATPMLLFSYGYNINNFQSFGGVIGNHCISLSTNLCFGQHRIIRKLYKNFDAEIIRENPQWK